MMRCGRTGAALLYGTGCVGCDCGGARSDLDDTVAYVFSGNPYQRHSRTAWTVDDPGFRPGVEVITDPADRRGFDAKPVTLRA